MLEKYPVTKIMFLDIETTSITEKFSELDERQQKNFLRKFKKKGTEEIINGIKPDGKKYTQPQLAKLKEEKWSELAPLSSIFGRILCISVGFLVPDQESEGYTMRRTSYYDDDEKILLEKFVNGPLKSYLDNPNEKDSYVFSAFHGMIFDFPFISMRLLINGLPLPKAFDFAESKPWENSHFIDLKKLLSFNVFDGGNSLDSLTQVFNIPSPKEEMSGQDVKDEYWVKKNLSGIVRYCEKDIISLSRLHLAVIGAEAEIRVPDGE